MERIGIAGVIGVLALACGLALALAAAAEPVTLTAGVLLGVGIALLMWVAQHWSREPEAEAEPAPPPARPAPKLEDLLGAVDDPLLLVEGRQVMRANAAAIRVLGEHVVGEDVRVAIRHPVAAELLAGESHLEGSVELIGLGAADRHWLLSIQPLGQGAKLVRLSDRTATRASERIRVDFVANASHELRTPLASLIGFIETLEDANGPDEAPVRERFLKIMAGEARRMQRLVDDLISLSRIEADKHRTPADPIALGALARETADTLRGERWRTRIELAVEDGLPPVTGDRAQLSQLLHNLVGNALKYGDPEKPVRVKVMRSGTTMIKLAVADEGEGIAAQHLPRLTERFYRVDAGRSRQAGGTGLGLAIVKHIVERHRGRLDITSTQGVGTTVTVLLPIAAETGHSVAAE
ncbi:ATPase [Sphingomonas sp. CGMCC 1.13654]|uniref:histidine kinase n=1 Tax=Sphingomonas chungangi TaxID=2683589 RepID=A0A838LDB3_9SPHN|nr:ATP-binding protein [Sphingomonas chungangi]MBA2936126.1 ATPase [Sphingomonas chungangi]MVW55513.1 ATPase [Sphingomonas chungangi]